MKSAPQELIRERLAAGAQRLRLGEALEIASWTAMVALGGMAVIVLVQKLFFLGLPVNRPVLSALGMPGWALWSLLGLLLAPLAAGLVAYALSRQGVLSAAMAVDERLGLRARLSSALIVGSAPGAGAMVPALVSDARRCAELIQPGRDFPLRAPRGAVYLPFGLCLLTLAAIFAPQGDVLGREKQVLKDEREREEVRLAAEEIEKKLQEALRRRPPEKREGEATTPSDKLTDDLSELVRELKDVEDRAQALTKLNQLLDKAKLAEMRIDAMAEMVRQMEQLRELGEQADLPKGSARETGMAMVGGDFKKAAEELEKLKEMLEKNKDQLTDEQKAELKRELEKLAKLTDDWKGLSEMLQKAADRVGQDDGLEAMDEAIEGLEELAKLMSELGLEPGEGLGAEGQRVKLTKEMVEQLKKMLQNAQRCDKCKKLHCLNCGKPRCACSGDEQCDCPPGGGDLATIPGAGMPGGMPGAGSGADGKGQGMGGYGQGEGGKAPEEQHDVKFQTTKVKGQMGEGRIVSHMFVRGLPSVTDDEKKTQFREAHGAAARAASEEVSSGRIPRELRDYVREYFDSTKPGAADAPRPKEDSGQKK